VRTAVIKLGERGCYVKHAEEPGYFSSAFRTEVVGHHGRGGFLCRGIPDRGAEGLGSESCAAFACAVAAMNIRAVGATAGIPTFEEARQFMKDQKG